MNRSITRVARKVGIRHVASHIGRYTMITSHPRNGEKLEVVSAVARHARPSITADLYRSVFDDEKRTAVYSLAEQCARRPKPEA